VRPVRRDDATHPRELPLTEDEEAFAANLRARLREAPDPMDDNYFVEAEHGLTVIASKGGPRAYDDHDPMAHATADEWDAYEVDDPEVRDVPSA
jgi:hypothetical protein